MDTESTTSFRRLPDLHDSWRNPQDRYLNSHLNLETYELDYSVLSLYPREQIAHKYYSNGAWDRKGALEKLRPYLIRSTQSPVQDENESNFTHTSMVFRVPEENALIFLDSSDLEVYAPSPEIAWRLGEELRQEFRVPPKSPCPHFFILKRVRGGGIQANYVKLTERDKLDDHALGLYYGDDLVGWQGRLLEGFVERQCGISILQGPPGTGKTTFIRHLMTAHGENLRFYFIPSSNFNVLKDEEFVGFWASERSNNPDKRLVIILEDAEAILATRAGDNRAEVSNLLNITDGLMGDFLKLHLVCTMNGDFEDLDPAILRPGRLLARRFFGNLPRERALALAQYLEKPAPKTVKEEYSLAELLCGDPVGAEKPILKKRTMGFAPVPSQT
jgi:hypothetical protein